MVADNRTPRRFYGRRHGRRLRVGRGRLLQELLPKLEIPAGDDLIDPSTLFEVVREYWLEIGFGGGEHMAAQAAENPDVGFIGCEPFINGIARLLTDVEDRGLQNIRLHADDARPLLDRVADASIARAFVLFPDPWPKNRHANRRFINPENLTTLARLLRDDGELRVASDEMGYIRWTLYHVRAHGDFEWTAVSARDWRERPSDWPPTRYEGKALAAGRQCVYLRFRRRKRL
jgi:tRNA (guanine-N7-)-methyltransferase